MARRSTPGATAEGRAGARPMSFRPETGLPDMDSASFSAEQRFEVLIPQEARFGALIQDNLHLPPGRYEVEVPPLGHHVLICTQRVRVAR